MTHGKNEDALPVKSNDLAMLDSKLSWKLYIKFSISAPKQWRIILYDIFYINFFQGIYPEIYQAISIMVMLYVIYQMHETLCMKYIQGYVAFRLIN